MSTEVGTGARVMDSILDAIGDTPLVRLSRLGREVKPELVAKVEALNPSFLRFPGGCLVSPRWRRSTRAARSRIAWRWR